MLHDHALAEEMQQSSQKFPVSDNPRFYVSRLDQDTEFLR